MRVSIYKRLSAYIIDILLLGMILMLIYYFIPENNKVTILNQTLNSLNESLLNNEIGTSDYLSNYSNIIYQLDKERVIFTIINLIAVFGYFVLVPFFWKSKTLGNYIVGYQIKNKHKGKIKLYQFIIRSIIINGLLYLFISILSVYILPSNIYFYVLSIFGFIQLTLVIISVFMIIYRHDKRGLQDILSLTNVAINKNEVKECENLQSKNLLEEKK